MRFVYILILVLLAAVGCARFQPVPLSASDAATAYDSRSLTNDRLRSFMETNGAAGQWPRSQWSLLDLTFAAFYYHPDLMVAKAQWESAGAGEKTAAQRPNPTVAVTPGYDSQIPSAPSPWIVPITFDLPIETAGKRRFRIEQARHLTEAAYWKWMSGVWRVRSEVRNALITLEAAERSRVLLDAQTAAQSNVVRLLEGQITAGAASEFELTQARVALDTAQLSRADAERQYLQSRAALAAEMGLPAKALDGAKFSESDLETIPTNLTEPTVRQQALLNRADVRAALAQYAASQSALQLAIAGQYPDVHLGPGYSYNSGSAGDNLWQLGLSVTLPAFNHNQGPVAEAQAQRREAAASFVSVQAQAIGQIDTALAGYRSVLAELRTADALMSGLTNRLQSMRSMEQAGEIEPLARATAEIEFSAGALSRLDALVKAQQTFAQLEDAAQSPLTLSESAMNAAKVSHEP